MRWWTTTTLRRDALLALLAVGLVAGYVARGGGNFPLDDAWIHQTYARNLAARGEWAFLPGQPSAASTSPLYTVLLAAGYTLGVPFRWWAHGLGAIALAASGLLAARLGVRATPNTSSRVVAGWAAGLTVIGAWHLVWAAASGMETALFALWTLVLPWLAWRETDGQHRRRTLMFATLRGARYGVVAALATLTRPEGILLAGLGGLALLLVRPAGWRAFWAYAFGAGVAFVLLLTPYLVLNWQLTGGLLPNTAAAKAADLAPLLALPLGTRLGMMLTPLLAGVQLVLVPGVVVLLTLWARRGGRALVFPALLALWPLALVVLYAVRLPANFQHGRYVMPALPLWLVAGAVGIVWLVARWQRPRLARVGVRLLAGVAAGVALIMVSTLGLEAYQRGVAIIDAEMVAVAHWLDANVPADAVLAVHDIGAVGYFAPRPLLDLAGLVSPEVIPIMYDADALWALMQQRGARTLMAFPDQIPGGRTEDPRLCLLYRSDGVDSQAAAGINMAVYALAYDSVCPPT